MNSIIVVLCVLLLNACAHQQSTVVTISPIKGVGSIPTTCVAAVHNIVINLDKQATENLLDTRRQELHQYQGFWGVGIRKGFQLWQSESPLRQSCAQQVGEEDMHPHTATLLIMEGVWKFVHDTNKPAI